MSNILYFIIFSLTFCSSYALKQKEDMFSGACLKMSEIQEATTKNESLPNIDLEKGFVAADNIGINAPNVEKELVEGGNVEIDINAPEYIVNELTSMGMPCTVRLYNEFGQHFKHLTSTFFSKVEKIDHNTRNLMLVIADHTYNKDKRIGINSTFKSSFGAKFWKVANEISQYLNKAGLLTTSLVSTVYLAFGGKCTFESDEAICQYEEADNSGSHFGLTFYDISKYLGPTTVFLYNFSDNICEKVINYSSAKKTMYKSLDLGADYFYFIKDFVADNGNIDLLPLQYKYGIVDFTNIPQSFFNEYGPFFTKATRLLLKESVEDMSHENRASIYVQKAQEDNILEKTYKKIDTYQWISGILNPLSGLCSLLVSTSLILHTCVNDEETKWFSQLCSVILLPLSYVINFASKKIDKALNKELKNYMLYAYYKHADKAAIEE